MSPLRYRLRALVRDSLPDEVRGSERGGISSTTGEMPVMARTRSLMSSRRRVRRLTRGLRARDPDVASDGQRVVFVRQYVGRSELAVERW